MQRQTANNLNLIVTIRTQGLTISQFESQTAFPVTIAHFL